MISNSVPIGRTEENRLESRPLRADDVPSRIIAHEQRFGRANAEHRQRPLEWRPMRLSPPNVHTKHRGIDLVEQTMTSQLLAPGLGWAPPGRIRDDGCLDARSSQRFQDGHGMRFEPGHREYWLQER